MGRLVQQYRVRGLAVIGPLETFEALANGQVDELLVSGALEETGAEILDTQGEKQSAKNHHRCRCPIS